MPGKSGNPPSFGAFRRACILVVDDSPTRTHLSPEHADPRGLCGDGEPRTLPRLSGWSAAPDSTWDCVLVNLLSPSFDGIELCRQLNLYRGLAPLPGTDAPTFAIVGLGNEEGGDMLARAFAAGVDDIVPSTIEPDVMRVRIRALVRRKLMQDENWRIEAELRERELALARARAEAASARGARPMPIASSRRRTTS